MPLDEKLAKPLWVGIIVFVIIHIGSWWLVETYPDHTEILEDLLVEPKQTVTVKQPFVRTYNDKEYMIRPQYDYEIYGLMVSHKNLDEKWFNIYYDRDPYNVKDACLIWGQNINSNDFHDVEFWNQTWTCWIQPKRRDVVFNFNQLSNNHLLPDTEEISDLIKKARPGDQVWIKGSLVNYSIIGEGGGERRSSTIRNDTGNGACEVVFVEDFKILKTQNGFWRVIESLSIGFAALLGIVKIYLFFFF